MNGLRRSVPLFVSLAFVLVLAGCSDSDDDPVSPTAPTPPAATFSVSGTVSETAPTASKRVEGVQVTSGTATATTNSNGAFTLTGVASGVQTLTFTKADYVTTTRQVTVAGANVTGVDVNLPSTPRIVREEHQATIRGDGPSCFGTSRSCHVYQTGAHSDGEVGIFLVWDVNDVNFELEMRCNQEVVDESLAKEPKVLEMRTPVRAGQQCELHVMFTGDTAQYGLFLSYPY
jgi:hypothetical protein